MSLVSLDKISQALLHPFEGKSKPMKNKIGNLAFSIITGVLFVGAVHLLLALRERSIKKRQMKKNNGVETDQKTQNQFNAIHAETKYAIPANKEEYLQQQQQFEQEKKAKYALVDQFLEQEGKTKNSQAQDIQSPSVAQSMKTETSKPKKAFEKINSFELRTIKMSKKASFNDRRDFFKAKQQNDYSTSAPILSKSSFVPNEMAEHLMRNKKNSALGVKYITGDAITNMEGALHTFLTPVGSVAMTADYAFKKGHSADHFGNNQVRDVVLSYAVQPDFENKEVMVALLELHDEKVEGQPLPKDFKVPTAEQKRDPSFRKKYDEQLRKHMIYNLTEDHALPAIREVKKKDILEIDDAVHFLETIIKQGEFPQKKIKGKFLKHNGKLLSLEMLMNSYLHQMNNEIDVLEKNAPQGYIYTIDPPAIFAGFFNRDATLLNRLQILAFQQLDKTINFKNLKAIAFNNYADKQAIPLYKKALPQIDILTKTDAFQYKENYALVLHNNSDAFGQNIETEGPSSMDGVIGSYSDAALVVERNRKDLCEHMVSHSLD